MGVGPMLAFIQDVADGAFQIEDVTDSEYSRIRELMDGYADQDLGFVDAAVVTLAERLNETKIATLDRRHFSVVRPRHVASFKLLPA